MKKTFTINLGGKIFNIDDDALEILQQYINTLKTHYSKGTDGDEIMYDIESRLAELFIEFQKQEKREAVTAEDVEKAITIMGKPEDILEDEAEPSPKQEEATSTTSQPKKLFRDPQDRILGGVASGIAAYLGIPVTLTRVCFLLLMLAYGVFFVIYIVMWMLLPRAITPRQRLQMRGKDVNVSSIEDSIRTGFQDIREKHAQQRSSKTRDILLIIGTALCFIICFRPLLHIVSIPIDIITHRLIPGFNPLNIINMHVYTDVPGALFLLKLATGALLVIPIFLLFYLLIQVFVPFKSKNKKVIIIALILWVIALCAAGYLSLKQGNYFKEGRKHLQSFIQNASTEIPKNSFYIKTLNPHHV